MLGALRCWQEAEMAREHTEFDVDLLAFFLEIGLELLMGSLEFF
jgi:hypothetical protein